jgi:hypothetical protein
MGTFDRGEDEACPPGYFRTSQNLAFVNQATYTREGSVVNLPTAFNIKRQAIYKRIGEAPRLLLLDTAGNLYDSTNLGVPILSIPAMTDFSMVSMFNRAYITPHNGLKGLPGEKLYVYESSGAARPAGGIAPAGNMVATQGAAGKLTGGRLFAVAFETQSGHIGAMGGFCAIGLPADTGFQVNLSSIPAGPAGTVARVLLATKDVRNFAGDYENQTWYFVPDGRIPDNVTPAKTVDFYDADLQSDASFLLDQMDTIPAGVGVNIYKGRLLTWGEDTNDAIVRVSQPGQPESFDGVDGFLTVNPGDAGGGVRYCFEYRTQLICCKPQRSYITQDNGQPAALWEVNALDKSVGTECHGVGKILDFGEDVRDRAFVADRSGLQLFVGTFSDTEVSFNVADIWDRINKAHFHKLEIAVDPLRARTYIVAPMDAATECSHMIVCDWQDGLDLESVKFSVWAFPHPPSTVVVDVNQADKESQMKFASQTNPGIKALDETQKLDYGLAIDSWAEFPLLPQGDDWPVYHFAGARMRIKGVGNLKITLSGLDRVQTAFVPDLPLFTNPGRPFFRGWNFSSERCSVMIRTNLANEFFFLTHFSLYYKELWYTRPE